MEWVKDYFKKFANEITINSESENFDTYTLSFKLLNIVNQFSLSDLDFIFKFINERDSVLVRLIVDDGMSYNFKPHSHDNVHAFKNFSSSYFDDETEIRIECEVTKTSKCFTRSIYNPNAFFNYINRLSLSPLLNILHQFLDTNIVNKLEVQNSDLEAIYFQSPLFIIATAQHCLNQIDAVEPGIRENILKNRSVNTNPQTFSNYRFIPSDFNQNGNIQLKDKRFLQLFEKLKICLASSYLANTSDIINGAIIMFSIYGHKYIEVKNSFNELEVTNSLIFYEIYQWVYEQGDTHDKLELARNIIGRYFTHNDISWNLAKDTLSSIQSAHFIYLKENVEQYIETKNKVAEIVTEMSVKSKEVTQVFVSGFKNNNLTLLTYFISLFIFNSLSDNSDKKIFSLEKYYLSLIFLLLSMIYLLITLRQFQRDVESNKRYFYSMKNIYKDIFEPKELNRLFHKNYLRNSLGDINKTVNMYSIYWIFEVVLLLVISIYLTFFL